MVRVRFAPSPTGQMHIGNLRTAIFNWVFAKKNHGKFFVRIEDTDKNRSTQEFFNQIFDTLAEMKIDFDPFEEPIEGNQAGIIVQSDRTSVYQKYAQKLLDAGFGFFCDCLPEAELCGCIGKSLTSGALRFKTPKAKLIKFNDLVFGNLEIKSDTLENFVLLRSDGSPTYMLAVVVDDLEMNISHVIRGEDHKTNTFKQILLYEALHVTPPKFAHLPMIIGADRKKLSKRNGNTSVYYYLQEGFVPDSLFNILLKLGWGSGNEEIISKEKIINIFEFADVKKSPAYFDEKKLYSFSGKYLRSYNYTSDASIFLDKHFHVRSEKIALLYPEVVKRANTFREFYTQVKFLFEPCNSDIKLEENVYLCLENIAFWSKEEIFSKIKELCQTNVLSVKETTSTLRLKITGHDFSPDIFLIMEILGQAQTLQICK